MGGLGMYVKDNLLNEETEEAVADFLVPASIITHGMAYLNSAVYPIIYYIMSAQFREQYKFLLRCGCCGESSGREFRSPHTSNMSRCTLGTTKRADKAEELEMFLRRKNTPHINSARNIAVVKQSSRIVNGGQVCKSTPEVACDEAL